jgi:hypothetical protein
MSVKWHSHTDSFSVENLAETMNQENKGRTKGTLNGTISVCQWSIRSSWFVFGLYHLKPITADHGQYKIIAYVLAMLCHI